MTYFRFHYRLSCGCGLTQSVEGDSLADAQSRLETELNDAGAQHKWGMPEAEYNRRGEERHQAFLASGGSYSTEQVEMTPELEAHLREILQHRREHESICKLSRKIKA